MYYDGKEWELNEIPYSDMEKKAAERNGMTIGSKFELPAEDTVILIQQSSSLQVTDMDNSNNNFFLFP